MFTIPVLNVKANPLDALLAAVGCRLSMLAKGDNEKFTDLLKDRNVTIALGSDADKISRYFTFKDGKFNQHSGKAENADLTIDFKDSATGIKLLTGGDVTAFMTAIQDKELTMEGDYSLLMWFNQLAKYIVPKVPAEVKPYVEKAKPYATKAKNLATQLLGAAKHRFAK